jgi:hypothetical protein
MTFAAFALTLMLLTLLVLAFLCAVMWRINKDDRGRR